jgi:hypothetical protein
METINKDFADRSWMRVNTKLAKRGNQSNLVGVKIVTALIICVSVMSLVAFAQSARAIDRSKDKLLITPEMVSFMETVGHGQVFTICE